MRIIIIFVSCFTTSIVEHVNSYVPGILGHESNTKMIQSNPKGALSVKKNTSFSFIINCMGHQMYGNVEERHLNPTLEN